VIRGGAPRALEASARPRAVVTWRWVDKPPVPAPGRRPDEPTPWGAYAGIVLLGLGLLIIGVTGGMHRWAPPPVPSATRLRSASSVGPGRSASRGRRAGPVAMSRSVPVSVRIPAIGVSAHIISVGLTTSGGVGVPSLSTPMLVGWYDRGAAPGQSGPAVLVGHVDAAATGPAVFYELGDLRPGDLIDVTRADHRTAEFRVTSVALYPQWDFPARQVYGATSVPALRLVTCGGDFDEQTHLYLDRTVALAAYVGQAA